MDTPSLALRNQLCFSLYSASLAMTKAYRPMLEALGLTYPQYLVLLVLWEKDARAVKELGEQLALDSGTLTPLLKRMEAAGLVVRTRDAADERRVVITLTEQARALQGQACVLPQVIGQALGLGMDEFIALKSQIDQIRDRLETMSAPSGT